MVIIENLHLAYIHIPKTAGTSITRWMQENFNARLAGSPHAGMGQIVEKKIRLPENPIFFTVVRNPFARQLSHYMYHLQMHRDLVYLNQIKNINDPIVTKTLERLEKGFEHWFLSEDEFVRPKPRWWDYRWTTQWEWVNSNTHIMKYENLDVDIQWLYKITKCSIPLPRENVSRSYEQNYKDWYSQKLKRIVEEKHQIDLVKFNYKF